MSSLGFLRHNQNKQPGFIDDEQRGGVALMGAILVLAYLLILIFGFDLFSCNTLFPLYFRRLLDFSFTALAGGFLSFVAMKTYRKTGGCLLVVFICLSVFFILRRLNCLA